LIAGYTVSEENKDRTGIDLRINGGGGSPWPSIDLQLKATINLGEPMEDGCFRFNLRIEDHRRLIGESQTPRYLVVYALPQDKNQWINQSNGRLGLGGAAYWVSLEDMEESDNRVSVTIKIPSDNYFDVDALRNLIDRSRRSVVYDSEEGGNDDFSSGNR
jgi:hypothetical protein